MLINHDFATRVLHADEKWAAKNTKADFAYLVALWAPYCDEEALRMMTDYNNWVRRSMRCKNRVEMC